MGAMFELLLLYLTSCPDTYISVKVLGKDASLRSWMYLKYKKLCSLPSIKIAPDVKSALEGIFELFEELSNLEDIEMGSDEDDSDPPKFSNQQYSVPRISNQHEISTDLHRQVGKSIAL